jgi:hypothetical protein
MAPADAASPQGASKGPREWPRTMRVLKDAISEAMLSAGEDYQIEDGPKVRAVDIKRVRETFLRDYVVDSDGSTAESEKDAKRRAFRRALEKAQALKLIAGRDMGNRQIVWFVSAQDESHVL